jgi:hypothetical protein
MSGTTRPDHLEDDSMSASVKLELALQIEDDNLAGITQLDSHGAPPGAMDFLGCSGESSFVMTIQEPLPSCRWRPAARPVAGAVDRKTPAA